MINKDINQKLNLKFGVLKLILSLLICALGALAVAGELAPTKYKTLAFIGAGFVYFLYLVLNIFTFHLRRKSLVWSINIVDLGIVGIFILIFDTKESTNNPACFGIIALVLVSIYGIVILVLNNLNFRSLRKHEIDYGEKLFLRVED